MSSFAGKCSPASFYAMNPPARVRRTSRPGAAKAKACVQANGRAAAASGVTLPNVTKQNSASFDWSGLKPCCLADGVGAPSLVQKSPKPFRGSAALTYVDDTETERNKFDHEEISLFTASSDSRLLLSGRPWGLMDSDVRSRSLRRYRMSHSCRGRRLCSLIG